MNKNEIDAFVQRVGRCQRRKGARQSGKRAYSKFLEGLMLLHKGSGIDTEYELYEAFKEIALLSPKEKLEVAREYRRSLKSDGYMILDLKIRKLIYKMISNLLPLGGVDILVPFSGAGELIDDFALNHKDANIMSEEVDEDEAKMQKKLFEACGIENVKVKNTDSLKSNHKSKEFDLIISQPPTGLKISSEDIKVRNLNIKNFRKLDAEKGFILRSLGQVKENGLIVGVFSPGFLFSKKYEKIRQLITEKMNVLSVIETPKFVYKKKNRNAAILIMKNKKNSSDKVASVLMASFEDEKINSDKFRDKAKELLKHWNEYVEDELDVN